jgi:hypothetical protein
MFGRAGEAVRWMQKCNLKSKQLVARFSLSLSEHEQRVLRPEHSTQCERGEADPSREEQLEQLRSRAENHQPHHPSDFDGSTPTYARRRLLG